MVPSPREPARPLENALERQPDRQAQCPQHGEYVARHVVGRIWSPCPTCSDEAEVRRVAEAAEERRRGDVQLAEEALHRRLRLSGLVGRFVDASFDTFEATGPAQESARTVCRDFVESIAGKKGGLWLVGPPGTGKTHLGSAMVNHLVREQRQWAAILSAREIVRMLRATWGKKASGGARWASDPPETEDEVIEHLGSISLLVLDEVGVGFGSESEMVQLFDVLDLRYRNELPTVLLSNLTATELKPALGDRAYDRLREGAVMVSCKWASHRASGSRS